MLSKIVRAFSVGAIVFAFLTSAFAGPMTGDSMSVYFAQPNTSTPYAGLCGNNPAGCFSSQNFVVSSGIETNFACCGGGQLVASIDFSDDALVITWLNAIGGNYGTAFQGFVFTDSSAAFDSINTVTGLNSSLVSVSGHQLFVNLGPATTGFSFNRGASITVTFGTGTGAIPEPGTLALAGLAFFGLCWQRRRQGKR